MFYYDEKTFERHAARPSAVDAEIDERARRSQQMMALRNAQEMHDAQQRLQAQRLYQRQLEQAQMHRQYQQQAQQRQQSGLGMHPEYRRVMVEAHPVPECAADGSPLLEFEVPAGCLPGASVCFNCNVGPRAHLPAKIMTAKIPMNAGPGWRLKVPVPRDLAPAAAAAPPAAPPAPDAPLAPPAGLPALAPVAGAHAMIDLTLLDEVDDDNMQMAL